MTDQETAVIVFPSSCSAPLHIWNPLPQQQAGPPPPPGETDSKQPAVYLIRRLSRQNPTQTHPPELPNAMFKGTRPILCMLFRSWRARGWSKVGRAARGVHFHASSRGLAPALKGTDPVDGSDEFISTEFNDMAGLLWGKRCFSKACGLSAKRLPSHPEESPGLSFQHGGSFTPKPVLWSRLALLITSYGSPLGAGQSQEESLKEGEIRRDQDSLAPSQGTAQHVSQSSSSKGAVQARWRRAQASNRCASHTDFPLSSV